MQSLATAAPWNGLDRSCFLHLLRFWFSSIFSFFSFLYHFFTNFFCLISCCCSVFFFVVVVSVPVALVLNAISHFVTSRLIWLESYLFRLAAFQPPPILPRQIAAQLLPYRTRSISSATLLYSKYFLSFYFWWPARTCSHTSASLSLQIHRSGAWVAENFVC